MNNTVSAAAKSGNGITWLSTRHSNMHHELGIRKTGRWNWEVVGHKYEGYGKTEHVDDFSGSSKSLLRHLREAWGL